ncbi:MAG: aspartate aminotransferase family protein, partial [Gemmatimonadota bacterium]
TSTTSVDPVAAAADLCERHDAWLHVDAAYAGPAASLPERRDLFEGWGRADSVVVNPHKWLFTPMDLSVLFFRDAGAVRQSLALTPDYLSGDEEGATNLMDYGLPLGRRFRALKLWFLFRFFGADGLRARLRAHLEWAGDFARWIEADERFERAAPAPFSTVCFRARRPDELPVEDGVGGSVGGREGAGGLEARNDWNRRLLESVNEAGRVFLSHTVLDGAHTLRLAVGSIRHRREDVRRAYDELVAAWKRLASEEEG